MKAYIGKKPVATNGVHGHWKSSKKGAGPDHTAPPLTAARLESAAEQDDEPASGFQDLDDDQLKQAQTRATVAAYFHSHPSQAAIGPTTPKAPPLVKAAMPHLDVYSDDDDTESASAKEAKLEKAVAGNQQGVPARTTAHLTGDNLKHRYMRLYAEIPGQQVSTFSPIARTSLIAAVAAPTPGEKMHQVKIVNVAEWHNPNRIIVELEIRVVTLRRRQQLLEWFRTDAFKTKAQATYARSTHDTKMARIRFSAASAKGSPHPKMSVVETVTYSGVGGLGAMALFGLCYKACLQCSQKAAKDELGVQRKYRSVQQEPEEA
jgi:hypothetical protein